MGDEEEAPINPATGDVYEGERNADGKRHGTGVAKYANGDVYEGAYAEGARSGAGKYYFGGKDAPKATYDGMYADNKKSGAGVLTYPDGTKVRVGLSARFATPALQPRSRPRRLPAAAAVADISVAFAVFMTSVRGQLGQRQAPRLRLVHVRQWRRLHRRVGVGQKSWNWKVHRRFGAGGQLEGRQAGLR